MSPEARKKWEKAPFTKARLLPVLLAALVAILVLGVAASGAPEIGHPRGPELVPQSGHYDSTNSAVFSPDGKFILTASNDRTARLWDATTGDQLRVFSGHEQRVNSAVFAPDGKTVLTGSQDGTARLWDASSGVEIKRFEAGEGEANVAFSRDGQTLLTTARRAAAVLWDVSTGREIRRFAGAHGWLTNAVFSGDGAWALTVAKDFSARIWDVRSGTEVGAFKGGFLGAAFSSDGDRVLIWDGDRVRLYDRRSAQPIRTFRGSLQIKAATFSPDSHLVCAADEDSNVYVWSSETGRLIGQSKPRFGFASVHFSPDQQFVLGSSMDGSASLWDVRARKEVRRFAGGQNATYATNFDTAMTPDGKLIVGGIGTEVTLWDTATGRVRGKLTGHALAVDSAALCPDSRHVLTTGSDLTVRYWDLDSQKQEALISSDQKWSLLAPDGKHIVTVDRDLIGLLWDFPSKGRMQRLGHGAEPTFSAAFSADGKRLVTVNGSVAAVVLDTTSGKELRRIPGAAGANITGAELSPDGRLVAVRSWDHRFPGTDFRTRLWNLDSGKEVQVFSHQGSCAAFGPEGKLLLMGSLEGGAVLCETATGKTLRLLAGAGGEVVHAVFSPTSNQVLTQTEYTLSGGRRIFQLWATDTGKEIARLEGRVGGMASATFTPDGKWVLGGDWSGGVTVWDATTGSVRCHLMTFEGGDWLALDPEGRFDTNNVDEVKGVRWVMPDQPFRALSPEVFQRTHYEPRLLARILSGDGLPAVPPVETLNRAQPTVEITSAVPVPGSDGELEVSVTVGPGAQPVSGFAPCEPYDLRIFRDGQLVGVLPSAEGKIPLDPHTGIARHTFRVRLAHRKNASTVELSAYAFNQDLVKSPTAHKTYTLAAPLPEKLGRAYVVTFGVNTTGNPAWDLRFAAPDARLMAMELSARLRISGRYSQVVTVPLISDGESADASRQNLQAVLARLSGKPVLPETTSRFPGGALAFDQLQPARPEDLVLLCFACHGLAEPSGDYSLFPQEVGTTRGSGATAQHLAVGISSRELAIWLRDVDAGDLALVLDTCHSGAVEERGFKPGPMGSRGLAQLAYDKGIRILAAAQADDVAFEFDRLRHGVLTYALVEEGLRAGRADGDPKDDQIMLDEWLAFAERRVPHLCQEVAESRFTPTSRGVKVVGAASLRQSERPLQAPVLFDFRRQKRDVLLTSLAGRTPTQ